jgi:hypothetical protein
MKSEAETGLRFHPCSSHVSVVPKVFCPAAYSLMMSYEKAARELPFLGFMFEMPIVVAGVGVSGG